MTRIILASTKKDDIILDPFTGSSTTGIAANLANRKFYGIDSEIDFINMSINRKLEIEDINTCNNFRKKIEGFANNEQYINYLLNEKE